MLKKLDKSLEEWILGAALIGMSIILMLQIIMRIFGTSLTWAEELARYFYVWSVFLSISYTIRTRSVLRVDMLVAHLPQKVKVVFEVCLDIINIVLYAFLAYSSVKVVEGVRTSGQTSPAMEIPMYIVYAIIPIGFVLASLRSVQKIYFDITGKDDMPAVNPAEEI